MFQSNPLSQRSPVCSINGAICSNQPLATEVGYRILRDGGNCVDACVGMAAALNVVEPCSTGIGGDCFALYYDANAKTVMGINGSGRSPSGLTLERASRGHGNLRHLPFDSVHAITVPGAAAGWVDAVEAWGNGSISLMDILTPAIVMARDGYPVQPVTAEHWSASTAFLQSQARKLGRPSPFLVDGVRAPTAGEVFRNPGLANTLESLGKHGKRGFYDGIVAERIVECCSHLGGAMALDDLSAHESTFPDPICVRYGDVNVWEIPPNGQGITALMALNILDILEVRKLAYNSPQYLHTLIEALRVSFADTRYYVCDPQHCAIPIDELLSKAYASKRAKLIDPHVASVDVVHGSPVSTSNTVSFCVVDDKGNACSFINSNYAGFGTGYVPRDCGFTLQNRGSNFNLSPPNHPNILAPRKRPYHTIIPGMATRADTNELYSAFSVMGGFMQPQGHVQVLLNMIDRQMDPQSALDAPRFCIQDGTPTSSIGIEEGIEDDTLRALKDCGHNVMRVSGYGRGLFGRGQIIVKNPTTSVLWSGTDNRGDGHAIGY